MTTPVAPAAAPQRAPEDTPLTAPEDARLPAGFGFRLAPTTVVRDHGRTLLVAGGGVLRLRAPAAEVVARSPVTCATPTAAAVARVLLDRDAAVPWWVDPPPDDAAVRDVTVVVPVRDRPGPLARLLAALPPGVPVVVVDDGSDDPAETRRVAAEHGARCLALGRNEGPAAARDHGLRAVRTPLVAFCDSDVTPEPGWLGTLRRHLDDPAVAVVGPRVLGTRAADGDGWIDRYEQARSSLDLGREPAAVRVRGRVAYLPAACLLARVAALGDGFDTGLRCGEDVDLVWRLLDAGWRVRYEPRAVVRHEHRGALVPWLARKAFYGTSAAPLAARHGDAVAPAVWAPWSLLLTGTLLAQRRWSLPAAGVTLVLTTGVLARRLTPDGAESPVPSWAACTQAALLTGAGSAASLRQAGSSLTRHYWPATLAACCVSSRARRAVALASVVEACADHRRTRPALDPVRYLVARRLDDAAYGTGLWWGAWRARSLRALLPARAGSRPGRGDAAGSVTRRRRREG